MRLLTLVCIIVVIPFVPKAQSISTIDSLKSRLDETVSEEKIKTLILLSEAYRFEDFDLCVEYGKEAIDLAEDEDRRDYLALTLKSLGVSYYFISDYDISMNYYIKSLEVYQSIGDKRGSANCLNNIGLIYEELTLLKHATRYHSEAYNLRSEINDTLGIAGSLNSLGNIYYYHKDYRNSLDNYLESAKLYYSINELDYLAMSYNNIAVIYQSWDKPKKSIDYYQRAMEIYKKTDNSKSLSMVLLNMAEVFNINLNDIDGAIDLNHQSLMIKKEKKDKIGIALILNNLGNLYARKYEYNRAEEYFIKSKLYYTELESLGGLTMVDFNFGKLYQKKEKSTSAISQFKKSLKLAEEIGYVDYIGSNQEALFECYVALGDYENFQKYYQLFKAGQDTLIEKLNTAEMLEIEARYLADESLVKLNQIKLESDIMANKLYLYKLLFYSLITIVFVALMSQLAFLLFKRKHNQNSKT